MKVYTYWRCGSCSSILRGDVKTCPNCSHDKPAKVKYMMPDDPAVLAARRRGELITSGPTHRDERGVVSEIVTDKQLKTSAPSHGDDHTHTEHETKVHPQRTRIAEDRPPVVGPEMHATPEQKKMQKDWIDEFAREHAMQHEPDTSIDDFLNDLEKDLEKEEPPKEEETPLDEYELAKKERVREVEEEKAEEAQRVETSQPKGFVVDENHDYSQDIPQWEKPDFAGFFKACIDTIAGLFKLIPTDVYLGAVGLAVLGLIIWFFVWLFTPVDRYATIDAVSWKRTVVVEEWQLCHESDWSVPAGGRITDEQLEIHHYDHVIDHYETKTRTYTERVKVGSHTEYSDNDDGTADAYTVDDYEDVTRTETYLDPVYRDDPVYQTKYYYDIDKWQFKEYRETAGNDQKPYYNEGGLPRDVQNPAYGDCRISDEYGTYTVWLVDEDGERYSDDYPYDRWIEFVVGHRLSYQSYRFSKKHIS